MSNALKLIQHLINVCDIAWNKMSVNNIIDATIQITQLDKTLFAAVALQQRKYPCIR